MLSPIIEKELSKEEFVRVIHDNRANCVAPFYYDVELDKHGCLPDVYDKDSLRRMNHNLTNDIILKSLLYAEDNTPIVSMVRHDRYARNPTLSEARFKFLKGISDEIVDLQSMIWDLGPAANGILIADLDGLIYDYPCNMKWQKSVLSTAMCPLHTGLNSLVSGMFDTVNYLSDVVRKKSDKDLSSMLDDYTLFIVAPSAVISFPFEDKNSLESCFAKDGLILPLFDSKNILHDNRPFWIKDFRREIWAYDKQCEYGKMSSFEINDINNQYN